jgi:Ca-activated chloride channel family protein
MLLIAAGGGYAAWRFRAYSTHILGVWFDAAHYRRAWPQLKWGLRLGGLICLCIALLGPYYSTGGGQPGVALGREIYFVVDVSASMNCTDVRPSRLIKAKRELKDLLRSLAGDRVGVIAFTDQGFVQCPLTGDLHTVELFLDMLETQQFSQTGTSLRAGLGVAMQRLAATRAGRKDVSQAIVLVSDGEDFGEGYTSVTERLKEQFVKVYAVGIGTPEGAAVPRMEDGQANGNILTAEGTPALSKLVEDKLREIAATSNTRYVPIRFAHEGLGALQNQLYELNYSPAAMAQEQVDNNLYPFFLLLGLLAIGATMVLMPVAREE